MAKVYPARDLRYEKSVAIKVLNPQLSAAPGQERFLPQIAILRHPKPPHILPPPHSGQGNG